jgi:hypothetical protein
MSTTFVYTIAKAPCARGRRERVRATNENCGGWKTLFYMLVGGDIAGGSPAQEDLLEEAVVCEG